MTKFEPKPFGRYVLLEKLAVGGMAEIYKAKTFGVDGFEKQLVIKRILPHCAADKDFISMLIDEAKLTVLLSHANIVQVYDLGKVGDDYFISMEFINGTNLRELMHRLEEHGERIQEDIAVYISSEICKGLDYAHRKTDNESRPLNIVHRDISPQNMLISYEGEVKIVDFGIAKAARNVSSTMAGILKGKIAYMSPEQALGKPVDNRTDVFSCGVVLYEMLTGDKLFQGESQFQILRQIRTKRISAAGLPDSIPAPLKTILAKALTYSPSDRYQTAGDLQIDLTKYLYSTYIDFSPRNLAALLHKFFKKELSDKNKDSTPELDEQTRSVIIAGAAREEIVVQRRDFDGFSGLSHETPLREPDLSGITLSGTPRPSSKWARTGVVALLLFGLGFGGTLAYRTWFETPSPITEETPVSEETPVPEEPPVAVEAVPEIPKIRYGSVQVITSPAGASVLIDGIPTQLKTPATIENLELGKKYRIQIDLEHYEPYEEEVMIESEKPLLFEGKLIALAHGVIEIQSDPPEASISLNGKELVLKTPARIDSLELGTNYTLQLSKEGHDTWKTTVQLKNFEPLQLKASLTRSVAAAPARVTAPPVVPEKQTLTQIRLTSKPAGARVFINGRLYKQRTPTTLASLTAGESLTLKVVKEGYYEWTDTLVPERGQTRSIDLTLEKISIDANAPAPLVAPLPTPNPASPSGETQRASVTIKSDPSRADVVVNGVLKGMTPLTITDITPGTVTIKLMKENRLSQTQTITITPGEGKDLGTIVLPDLYGELRIRSVPARADIFIDGEEIAPKTPITIRKVPRDRPHTIKLQMKGYQDWESSFDMKDSDNKTFDVTLQKE